MRNITILGCGNGGRSAASEIALRGHRVTLYEMPQFAESIAKIQETKVIKAIGIIEGTAQIHKVTCESVIHIAGAVLKRDFYDNGRTLERCGIKDMDIETLINYVKTGKNRNCWPSSWNDSQA